MRSKDLADYETMHDELGARRKAVERFVIQLNGISDDLRSSLHELESALDKAPKEATDSDFRIKMARVSAKAIEAREKWKQKKGRH